jgi:hypothetical protein
MLVRRAKRQGHPASRRCRVAVRVGPRLEIGSQTSKPNLPPLLPPQKRCRSKLDTEERTEIPIPSLEGEIGVQFRVRSQTASEGLRGWASDHPQPVTKLDTTAGPINARPAAVRARQRSPKPTSTFTGRFTVRFSHRFTARFTSIWTSDIQQIL